MALSPNTSAGEAHNAPVMTQEDYAAAYGRGYSKTVGFMLSRGISRDMSEDLAQAAWTKGWQYRGQIRDHQKVESWVNSIAFNLFRGSFRQSKTVELLAVDDPASPPNIAQAIDCRRILAQCSPSERRMVEGHYVAGFTSKELGRRLGCSAVAVRVRLLRLRRRLQETMRSVKARLPYPVLAPPAREAG